MKYSYEKCKKFLEKAGFQFIREELQIKTVTDGEVGEYWSTANLREIVEKLNDIENDNELSVAENVIFTLLYDNQDKLRGE